MFLSSMKFTFSTLLFAISLPAFVRSAPGFSPKALFDRDGIPTIPPRPADLDDTHFHGVQFEYLSKTGWAPALDAMPMFLYSRTIPSLDPCYPESAIDLASHPPQMNKGTDSPIGINPGVNCKNPQEGGHYVGAYTLGDAFPVYVSATRCGDKDEWRVNYSLYYVHDGAFSGGHRHDWEGVSVTWKRSKPDQDWWHRDSMIYRTHGWRQHFGWGDLETVDVDTGANSDYRRTDLRNKRHAKVYVGFYSHSSFPHKDITRATASAAASLTIANDEYRSDDWWRMPRIGDIHDWTEISPTWKYGPADGTPPKIQNEICTY